MCLLGAIYSSFCSLFTCSSNCSLWQCTCILFSNKSCVSSASTENKSSVFLQATNSQNTAAGGRQTTRWFIGVTASWFKSPSPFAGCAISRSAPSPCKHRCPAAIAVVPSWHLSLERRWLKLDLCFSDLICGCLSLGALKYLCASLQRRRTVRMWCYFLLVDIRFLGLLVPITFEIIWIRKEVLSWSRHLCSGHLEVIKNRHKFNLYQLILHSVN